MEKHQEAKMNSFLTFKIDEEIYAANVSKVLSILELTKITKIPRTPDYIRGVINLRGTVLPIVDLRIKFGLSPTEFTSNTCILVLEITMESTIVKIGALVDAVQEVLELEDNDIMPAPNFGAKFKSEFIDGMYKAENSFIMILNMDMIFTHDELTVMSYSEAILADNKDIPEIK
jgi:Chemotaxis signal transduction protein